jgi:hypothetical protein
MECLIFAVRELSRLRLVIQTFCRLPRDLTFGFGFLLGDEEATA